MENKMTDELNIFIDKLQRIAMELYDEYSSLDTGIEHTCELTELIDNLYAFSLLNNKEAIN